jgi:hypothetical protein
MIAYQFTWKYEIGVELHQIQEHPNSANRSCREEDVSNASAGLERSTLVSASTIRGFSESGHLGIDLDKRLLKALSLRKTDRVVGHAFESRIAHSASVIPVSKKPRMIPS